MKYIDAEKLIAKIDNLESFSCISEEQDGFYSAISRINDIIDSLQHELTTDTDVLHTELVNLLKTYRIGEETARNMADRIADTYGAQRYMDGLCDGMDKEDMKKEQPDEVDFEGVWKIYYDDHLFNRFPMPSKRDIARHFYELGLNATKEE